MAWRGRANKKEDKVPSGAVLLGRLFAHEHGTYKASGKGRSVREDQEEEAAGGGDGCPNLAKPMTRPPHDVSGAEWGMEDKRTLTDHAARPPHPVSGAWCGKYGPQGRGQENRWDAEKGKEGSKAGGEVLAVLGVSGARWRLADDEGDTSLSCGRCVTDDGGEPMTDGALMKIALVRG